MSDSQPTLPIDASAGPRSVRRIWFRPPSAASGSAGPRDDEPCGDDDDGEEPCRGFPRRAPRHACIGLLGEGGFGRVYLARQESPRRRVAVKVANPELAERLDVGALLAREAEVLDAVRGPRVAHVYEFAADGDPPFFAMEFVDGRTLTALLGGRVDGRRRALPMDQALRLFRSLAEAIRDLHLNLRPLIHLDLKPSNVMVLADDSVKVLDLGLSRVRERRYSRLSGVDEEFIGALVGFTPEYAAPEQVDEKSPVSFPSDCWAFGAMLFEVLTGQLPFGDAARWEYLDQVRASSPRLELLPAEAAPLRPLIQACLARDPARRPAHGHDLLCRLDTCLGVRVEAHSPVANNLPRIDADDPFVGRERSLRQLVAMLGSRSRSLVVLHGISGVGKSRLAAEACASLLRSTLGAWKAICWVDLGRALAAAPPIDGDQRATIAAVQDAIAGELQLTNRVAGESSVAEATIDRALLDRPTLLVLDSADFASEAASEVVRRLFARHRHLSVLVTTFDPAPFPESTRLPVEPLGVPSEGASPEPWPTRSAAVELFARIASSPQVRAEFTLDDANLPDVAELCRRVGGLPLGIRLVAGLMRTLTPRQALARLGSIVATAPGGARPRSLNDSIDASLELAGPAGRALCARLRVFAGPASFESIGAICCDPTVPGGAAEQGADRQLVLGHPAWSLLLRLEALGLVQRRRAAPGGLDRFQLLELARARVDAIPAVARSAAEPADAALLRTTRPDRLERRFVAWYLRQVTASLPGKEPKGWLQWRWADDLSAESANVEKLWRLCAATPDRRAERLARYVRGLYLLWWDRGTWRESWSCVESALEGLDRIRGEVARMSLLNAAGNVAIMLSKFDAAHRCFVAAGQVAEQACDRRRALIFAANRSLAALRADDAALAAALAEAALERAAASGHAIEGSSDESVLQSRLARAEAWMRLRRFDESREERLRLLQRCGQAGDHRRACDVEGGLALAALATGDARDARRWLLAARKRDQESCRSQLLRTKHVVFFGLLCAGEQRWRLAAAALGAGLPRHARWGGQCHRFLQDLVESALAAAKPHLEPALHSRLRRLLAEASARSAARES